MLFQPRSGPTRSHCRRPHRHGASASASTSTPSPSRQECWFALGWAS